MAEDDLVYLVRRAADARALALKSRHAKLRAVHSMLAKTYDDRVSGRGCPAAPGQDD